MTDCTHIISYGITRGSVWQGGGPDVAMHEFGGVPRERMLVQMAADIPGLQTPKGMRVMFYGIDDGPSGVIPDNQLVSLVEFFCAWLEDDKDIIIGCFLGRSRSTYINAAIMIAMTGWSLEACLKYIGERREISIMPCFVEQLKKLEYKLTFLLGVRAA